MNFTFLQYWLNGMVLIMYVVGFFPLSQTTLLWSNYDLVSTVELEGQQGRRV